MALEERSDLFNRACAAFGDVAPADLNRAVSELIPVLEAEDAYAGGIVAMAIGALIESGADPRPACGPLRAAAIKRMKDATRFARTWSAGDPGPGDGTVFIEGRHAQLGKVVVTPDSIQPWAARDVAGARAWSRLDDWFCPLMAVARLSDECKEQMQRDGSMKTALDDLMAADWCVCTGFDLGNTRTGVHLERLMKGGPLPLFADDVSAREEAPAGSSTAVFDDLAEFLCKYCDRPDVVIKVEMNFLPEPFTLKVVRHIRDPENLFDRSGNVELQLPTADFAFVKAKAVEYIAIMQQWENKQVTSTLSVYKDGAWSYGGSSTKR